MATTTMTTTLAIQPGSSHANAGQNGSPPSSVAPNGQNHSLQQANTSPSTTSALQTLPSPVSRPASPSSSTSVSSPGRLSTVPTVRITRTRFRRCWEIVQTIAAWVAIAFTIGSFVRDYLDVTKDRPPSPQESWELQNAFRHSCEYDRRAELQSDACDLALSTPASPPPMGISKRALRERSVLHAFERDDYTLYGLWALLVLATVVVSSRSINSPLRVVRNSPISARASFRLHLLESSSKKCKQTHQIHRQISRAKNTMAQARRLLQSTLLWSTNLWAPCCSPCWLYLYSWFTVCSHISRFWSILTSRISPPGFIWGAR